MPFAKRLIIVCILYLYNFACFTFQKKDTFQKKCLEIRGNLEFQWRVRATRSVWAGAVNFCLNFALCLFLWSWMNLLVKESYVELLFTNQGNAPGQQKQTNNCFPPIFFSNRLHYQFSYEVNDNLQDTV